MLDKLLAEQPTAIMQDIIELCPNCVIAVDRSGVVRIFNRAAESLMGYADDEAVGRLTIADIYGSEETARQVKKKIHGPELGGPGRIEGLEINVLTRFGHIVPVRLSATLLHSQGSEVGSIGFFHDLRSIKKAEEERVARATLKGALEMASAAAHELSQPLQVITSDSAFLLKEEGHTPEQRGALRSIVESVRRLGAVVNKIQRLTRYETVTYVGDKKMIDLDKASR